MKALIAFFILTLPSFAYAQDGYHVMEEIQCEEEENCLINRRFDHIIKLIPVENRRGEIVGSRVLGASNISDTVYPGSNLCYIGQSQDLCKMLDQLSNGETSAQLSHFRCVFDENSLSVSYIIKYEMSSTREKVSVGIYRCE